MSLTPIPLKMRDTMALNPFYQTCSRNAIFNDHECQVNPVTKRLIEWEHAFVYAGKRLNEIWAIIPLCWWAHEGPGKNKEMNQYIAVSRATTEDFAKYPRLDWLQLVIYLSVKFNMKPRVLFPARAIDWMGVVGSNGTHLLHGPEGNCPQYITCSQCAEIDEKNS